MTHHFEFHHDHIHEWEFYAAGAETEYLQCEEEGLDIEPYKDLFDAATRMPQDAVKQKLGDVLFEIVQCAKQKDDYPFNEPSSYEEIRALCKPVAVNGTLPDRTTLRDKIEGAWLGRMAGCMLGKSIEGIRTHELHPFLRETNNFPLHRYIRRDEITEEHCARYSFPFTDRLYIDQIHAMPPDDDTNYTVMAQRVITCYGHDFTPLHVLQSWPYAQRRTSFCTAERVAYCNYMKGLLPPDSALYQNPYREWIGAQIRADYYGYINPGNPEKASEMAFRDASISHVKNGIYGAMFVAAMLSYAAVTDDIETVIEGGLGQIPVTSRLYASIQNVLTDYRNGVSEQEWFENLHKQYNEVYGHYWAHTIPNAMIVTAALLYGKGDFSRSICIAVENGFDTDCNGATVGSILGLRGGTACIDDTWTAPFHRTLHTTLTNSSVLSLDTLIDTTMTHILR